MKYVQSSAELKPQKVNFFFYSEVKNLAWVDTFCSV